MVVPSGGYIDVVYTIVMWFRDGVVFGSWLHCGCFGLSVEKW